MGQPYNLRKGWQSENLARYLLSKIAFVSQPVTISDDAGTDFFCTLFEIASYKKRQVLLPRSTFAIQVKSKSKGSKFEITEKESYIRGLEVPFFWGVVDKNAKKIKIYSGEYFELFFAHIGGVPKGNKLFVELMDIRNENERYYAQNNKWYIKFPKVGELDIDFDYSKSKESVQSLFKTCELMLKNISARVRGIHMFELYNGSRPIITGPYSCRMFRKNVYETLTEAFYNLDYLKKGGGRTDKEFEIYAAFFNELDKLRHDIPDELYSSYKKTLRTFKNKLG